MQEKIKEILSVYLKMPAEQINAQTAIDRTAVSSSILLHRMYAKLADAGIVIDNYQQIRTMGELLTHANPGTGIVANEQTGRVATRVDETVLSFAGDNKNSGSVGIDIEMVSAMPVTDDFREDNFYTMNFSAAEISYAILQTNPYASFAGLFAAKEAIVKADNNLKGTNFNQINIQHQLNGRPFHPAFNISISHTGDMAAAVAIPAVTTASNHNAVPAAAPVRQVTATPALVWLVVLTSLVLSVIAIFLITGKN